MVCMHVRLHVFVWWGGYTCMYREEVEVGYLPWLLSPLSFEVRSPTGSQSPPIQLVISQLALRNTLPLCKFELYTISQADPEFHRCWGSNSGPHTIYPLSICPRGFLYRVPVHIWITWDILSETLACQCPNLGYPVLNLSWGRRIPSSRLVWET